MLVIVLGSALGKHVTDLRPHVGRTNLDLDSEQSAHRGAGAKRSRLWIL